MQSRLWEPLNHLKLETVQLGMGHPSGGVMEERGWSAYAAVNAVLDKARRPVRRDRRDILFGVEDLELDD